jgi:post-segregation antitoxin (ccd killing protein)
MREELPDCLPEQWTTGTIKLFQNLINDLKKNISLLVLMLFLFSFNAFGQPPKIDLDQLRNGGNSGPPPGTSTSWVNGNLGSANSHYREGYSVPYRARLNNIPTTTTITVVFAFDIKHSGRNALDYLTYYRRNQPHTGWTPEHLEEAVNPLDGAQGSYVTPPTYAPIPCPTINASYIPATPSPQPSTSCNTLPPVTDPVGLPAGRQHDMTIWNGTIDSIRYVVEGDLNASQSEARIKVSFRATSSDVVLAWGGHIGSRIDWGYDADGVPRSAGGISGSPYHMRIISWGLNGSGAQDGSLPNLGNTDRSLSADAVARPPECADLDFTTTATNPLCPNSVNTYGVVVNPLACSQPAYQWTIPAATNTSNAFIVGLATGQNIQVNSGTQCGSFTVQVTVICTEGTIICDTTINVVDLVPPTLSITGHNPNAGCNPTSIPFGSASATDNCTGTVSITSTAGSITTSGCNRSQTMTWNAVDACNNSSSTSRTVSWIEDNTPPVIAIAGHVPNAGCNPTGFAFGTASATDNCGTADVTSSTGSITSSGCNRSQTRFWTATDACNNSSSTSRTVSWIEDNTPPVITITGHNPNAGCNPSGTPFGTASATDNCGTADVTSSTGSITSSGCNRSQTRFWTATDACNNSSSTSRTVNWIEDNTPPVIAIAGHVPNAGCNPSVFAFGTASATDNCGTADVTSSTGSITSSGCNRSQTRFWTATDACNNSTSTSRTVTWTVDLDKPTFTDPPASIDIDCNTTVPSVPAVNATDNCGSATVTGPVIVDNATDCGTGFSRVITRTWTATDACGNTQTHTQTIRVRCCLDLLCTYTQGAYGTEGGDMCDGENNGFTTLEFINEILTNYGGSFSVGKPGNSVLVNSAQCVIDKLPGGGGSKELVAGDVNLCVFTPLQSNGGVKNVLLAQTITLGLNLGITNTQLGSFTLQSGVLATANPLGGCGDDVPTPRICHYNVLPPYNLVSVENEYTTRTFYQNVIDAIPGANTVANLYELANRALANVDGIEGREAGVPIDSIQKAVASVNEVFDGCKVIVGWNVAPCPAIDPTPGDGIIVRAGNTSELSATTPDLSVSAFPNPYTGRNFSVKIKAPVSGKATIEFFTINGQKISEITRTIIANRDELVNFNVPGSKKTQIVYLVRIGKYVSRGVVLNPN